VPLVDVQLLAALFPGLIASFSSLSTDSSAGVLRICVSPFFCSSSSYQCFGAHALVLSFLSLIMFKPLSDFDSELLCGGFGPLIDLSVLNGADFGQGSNFVVGYVGGNVAQGTNGGAATGGNAPVIPQRSPRPRRR
jgi:hypothetical protein